MGCGMSKEDADAALARQRQGYEADYAHERTAMAELDARTKVGHLLIELRNLGFVEIQGKDIGGIYARLDEWLRNKWRATKTELDIVDVVREDDCGGCCGYEIKQEVGRQDSCNELCDASYVLGRIDSGGRPMPNGVFRSRGNEGENNIGKLTMQLVNFMTNECGWTLQVCDAGNNGFYGQIREQQIKFKAPHPLNLIAPHIMIELRSVGYIEINGPNSDGIHGKLNKWLTGTWKATASTADPDYCDLKYSCSKFHKRGSEGENNMGLCTMEVVDFMVKTCGWTMVTCNAGNFGRKGDKREQQLVFRNDEHVQHGLNHTMVELRTSGYIEVNGMADAQDFGARLDDFAKQRWGCTDYKRQFWEGSEAFCDKKYATPSGFYYREHLANNLGKRTLELADFAGKHGWSLLLCNGGSITPEPRHHPNNIIREQQVKFTKCENLAQAQRPLLMVELRTQPTDWKPTAFRGFIEINGRNTNGIHEKLGHFITQHMRGRQLGRVPYCDLIYEVGVFRLKEHSTSYNRWDGRLNGESNIGKWTMRLCDFMVDHVGEWDMIVCNSDNVDWNYRIGKDDWIGVTGREMQLVFRHRPGGRAVFMAASRVQPLGRPPLQAPQYWKDGSREGRVGHEIVPGTKEELAWMQEVLDGTFKKKATRDRSEALADRFVAVSCLRSEHPALWDKFARRRHEVQELCQKRGSGVAREFVAPKTEAACAGLAERCRFRGANPTCQAFLLHGTNPTSAVAILDTSFKVDFAGKSAGTMFGPGIYLAEASSKADEYARDDAGGEYSGLYAMLVCRAVLGRPCVVTDPGNYAERVTSGSYDVVVGDREKAVGTYREFIFFHEGSVYPEYAVFYRREGAASRTAPVAAPAMHTMGGGSGPGSGARWQWQGGAGGKWHAFSADVAAKLGAAKAAAAKEPVRFKIGEQDFEVDLGRMVQKNLATGKERPVRLA